MFNHLLSLLEAWEKDCARDWVLGTIFRTHGSAYRKAGSMMLINSDGQYMGMLSGGCLEADIVLNAKKVFSNGQSKTLVYDSTDEDDWSYRLGIGCGGRIELLLQHITLENDLGLRGMLKALRSHTSGLFEQCLESNQTKFLPNLVSAVSTPYIDNRFGKQWLVTNIAPEPHLLIIGGGRDAIPLLTLASTLGWSVTVTDPRASNARPEHFRMAYRVLSILGQELSSFIEKYRVDAVVVMSHNIEIDAQGLRDCQYSSIKYLALLGPSHRYQQVMSSANLDVNDLPCEISAPAGIDLGGVLPESVALSILSECHAVLHKSPLLEYKKS